MHAAIFSESAVSSMNGNDEMVLMAQLLDAGEHHSPKSAHKAQTRRSISSSHHPSRWSLTSFL